MDTGEVKHILQTLSAIYLVLGTIVFLTATPESRYPELQTWTTRILVVPRADLATPAGLKTRLIGWCGATVKGGRSLIRAKSFIFI